ncbi:MULTISPECIES: hypothetical protein [Mycobacteriaceae]|jgi:hypothetical protein|uniref:Uncharacterized protein n=2 Tax=Mycobacteriaceae TaxID=1762 RepID=A0ABR5FMU9_9MYCO|nr:MULTISPECIES: hypothetical protein [Mycobacteriaceae]KLI09331.1 hypothetical protein AA982_04605 [Mycolicibacterium senegalense]KLO47723.1 hypothetical protein ABW05_31625 [Mycolicibacterium senegalense]OHT92462.1 hypothetical protein BKG61_24230 [Mycobacterium syngnathidarum]OLT97733.1 hypothetical protein BKG60_05040 [Mycobacterium syngnathidarum]OMB84099.1 hypothetical protein A5741_20980 [Mycolicibacterium conceptionense]
MDWRASLSQAAQADLDRLFADSIQVAGIGLEHQNLAPFMLVVATNGDRAMRNLGAPSGQRSVDAIITALQDETDAESLRARATVMDVTVREPFAGDAINIRLEHREGQAIDILVPYRTTDDGITIDGQAMTASVDVARLWPTSPP